MQHPPPSPDPHGPADGFPAEADWLSLEPPPIGADFVDATLRLVRRAQQAAEDQPADVSLAAPLLDPALRDAFAPPEPSADFVASTAARVRTEQAARFRALLLEHEAPIPTPDFVARTLRALGFPPIPTSGSLAGNAPGNSPGDAPFAAGGRRRGLRGLLRRLDVVLLAAALVLAAVLAFAGRGRGPTTTPGLRQALLADWSPSLATAHAATPIAALAAGLGQERPPTTLPPPLPAHAPDGLHLLALLREGGR